MTSKLNIPAALRQRIHAKFVDTNYKQGVFIFKTISDNTIDLVLESFIEWSVENKKVVGGKLDLLSLLEDDTGL